MNGHVVQVDVDVAVYVCWIVRRRFRRTDAARSRYGLRHLNLDIPGSTFRSSPRIIFVKSIWKVIGEYFVSVSARWVGAVHIARWDPPTRTRTRTRIDNSTSWIRVYNIAVYTEAPATPTSVKWTASVHLTTQVIILPTTRTRDVYILCDCIYLRYGIIAYMCMSI